VKTVKFKLNTNRHNLPCCSKQKASIHHAQKLKSKNVCNDERHQSKLTN